MVVKDSTFIIPPALFKVQLAKIHICASTGSYHSWVAVKELPIIQKPCFFTVYHYYGN